MTAKLIVAIIFIILALPDVFFFCFSKNSKQPNIKKFLAASSIVYLSGTIFILILVCCVEKLNVTFTIVAELTILLVFVLDVFFIKKMGKALDDIRLAAQQVNETKADEDDKQDS